MEENEIETLAETLKINKTLQILRLNVILPLNSIKKNNTDPSKFRATHWVTKMSRN